MTATVMPRLVQEAVGNIVVSIRQAVENSKNNFDKNAMKEDSAAGCGSLASILIAMSLVASCERESGGDPGNTSESRSEGLAPSPKPNQTEAAAPRDDFNENVRIDTSLTFAELEVHRRRAINNATVEQLRDVFEWYEQLNPGETRFTLINSIVNRALELGEVYQLDLWIAGLEYPEERRGAAWALSAGLEERLDMAATFLVEEQKISDLLREPALQSFAWGDPTMGAPEFRALWDSAKCPHRDLLLAYVVGMRNGHDIAPERVWALGQQVREQDRIEVGTAILQAGMETNTFGEMFDLVLTETKTGLREQFLASLVASMAKEYGVKRLSDRFAATDVSAVLSPSDRELMLKNIELLATQENSRDR